jgi:transcriptional regulator with XRE-family HTH domain
LQHEDQHRTIGKRIRALRQALGLSQADLSRALDIGRSYLSHLEHGQRNITQELATSLFRHYRISTDWLLHGIGEMFVANRDDELASTPHQALHAPPAAYDPDGPLGSSQQLVEQMRHFCQAFEALQARVATQEQQLNKLTQQLNRLEARQEE